MKVAKPTSRPLAAGTRRVTSQSGSTLVWVMVVILVMVVVLGIGLTAVSGRLNLSVVRHEEHQAYYTALSSTETVAAWIMDGEDVAAVDLLLERIADMPEGITMEENGLPSEVGTCTVNLRWANDEQTILKITSTATLAERSETVSLTLTYTAQTPQGYAGELQVSHYDVSQYVASAKTLNELSIGTPIRIGDRVTTN
ncbi:MAG: hypothetical protein LBH56_00105, partial [Coriobacteriales bacterium]|nr:hypothetical protein [Coriobacteriales bacterium]